MPSSSAVTLTVPPRMTRPSFDAMPSSALPVTESDPVPAIVRSAVLYSAALGVSVSSVVVSAVA